MGTITTTTAAAAAAAAASAAAARGTCWLQDETGASDHAPRPDQNGQVMEWSRREQK